MANDNGRRLAQRAGLGLTFGAGLGLIVGVLAPSSSLAVWIAGGARVGIPLRAPWCEPFHLRTRWRAYRGNTVWFEKESTISSRQRAGLSRQAEQQSRRTEQEICRSQ